MNNERDINISLLGQLKLASIIEASTLAALVCVAVPLKHLCDWPTGVRATGPLHGLAFVFYGWVLLQTIGAGLWSRRQIILLGAAAFVPLAGFLASKHVQQRIEALRGEDSAR